MRIVFNAEYSGVYFADQIIEKDNPFITKNGKQFTILTIAHDEKHKEMVLCHEIAHVLLCRQDSLKKGVVYDIKMDIKASRLAKSFCKPEYWYEEDAKDSIRGYVEDEDNWLELYRKHSKLLAFLNKEIVPINKGISLR